MSEARKKLSEEEHKLTVGEARKWSTRDTLSGMTNIEEIERKEKEVKEKIKAKEEEIKRKKEAIKKERKKIIYTQVQMLRSMADDEGKDTVKYRDAAKSSQLPTMISLLFNLASEEQTHEQRLRKLAAELDRTTF